MPYEWRTDSKYSQFCLVDTSTGCHVARYRLSWDPASSYEAKLYTGKAIPDELRHENIKFVRLVAEYGPDARKEIESMLGIELTSNKLMEFIDEAIQQAVQVLKNG